MVPDGFLNVDTPENVAFDMELAGIGSRFMAALVDSLIIVIPQVALSFAASLLVSELIPYEADFFDPDYVNALSWVMGATLLLSFVLFWGYYLFFEWRWNGQTPGKRLVGLRVMRTDGRPVTFTEVLIRNLVRLIDFMPIFYGLGVIVMFGQRHWRRLGDLAAGTLVVFDQKPVSLESLARDRKRYAATGEEHFETGDGLPVEKLTAADIYRVEEFLDRWISLIEPEHVANAILRSLSAQMALPPPETVTTSEALDQFRQIVGQWHARQRRQ
jgi:uncharacterized RDD family membrane protein YckC